MKPEQHPFGLHAALGFFTGIPVPPVMTVDQITARRAIRWFWVAGVILGVAAAVVAAPIAMFTDATLLAGTAAVSALAYTTGAIHIDGVADTADGLGSRKEPEQALTIMRRSDIGPMGVAALVLVLLVEVSSLSALAQSWRWFVFAVVTGPAVGRVTMAPLTTKFVPMARQTGFGALFGRVTPVTEAAINVSIVTLSVSGGGWIIDGWRGGVVVAGVTVISLLFSMGWTARIVRRFRGMTGDTFGSSIELTQALFWAGLAVLS